MKKCIACGNIIEDVECRCTRCSKDVCVTVSFCQKHAAGCAYAAESYECTCEMVGLA